MTSLGSQLDQPAKRSLRRPRGLSGDDIFRTLLVSASAFVVLLITLMAYDSIVETLPVFQRFGVLGFVFGTRWSPAFVEYGALPFIYGTMLTSFLALLIAVPLAVLIALLISEMLPRRLANPIAVVVDLLAAIPSVIWGIWVCWCSCRSSGPSSRRWPAPSVR